MEVSVKPGKYVVAVSGGVDSMVLLDLLSRRPGIKLVVAHFDHGIRLESNKDAELVASEAERLKLPFEVGYGHLGNKASEESARRARYEFIERVQNKHKAKAVIAAHHQDDLIETAILNILRGTGPRGLIAIAANNKVMRPLLSYSKKDILAYAKANKLRWNEDPTNQQNNYLRNYIRNTVLINLTDSQRQTLIRNIDKVAKTNNILSIQIAKISQGIYRNAMIDRRKFTALPVMVGNELIVRWLRELGSSDFDKQIINRVNVALRTSKPGRLHPIKGDLILQISQTRAHFTHTL